MNNLYVHTMKQETCSFGLFEKYTNIIDRNITLQIGTEDKGKLSIDHPEVYQNSISIWIDAIKILLNNSIEEKVAVNILNMYIEVHRIDEKLFAIEYYKNNKIICTEIASPVVLAGFINNILEAYKYIGL